MKIRLARSLTRVEGDSELVIVRKKDQQIDVAYRMPSTRDFRNILIGQQVGDLPKIVPRICGICPLTHRIGALKALEATFSISPPPTAELIRELGLLGEVVRSHTYSVFFSTLPDLMYLASQVSRQDIIGVDKTQSRVLPLAIELYRVAEELANTTAGNTNMGYNFIIGGILKNISSDQQEELIRKLYSLLPDIKWVKELYHWLLNEVEGEIQHFTLPNPLFISCFDTKRNLFSGTNKITFFSTTGPITKFPCLEFPDLFIEKPQPEVPTSIGYTALQHLNRHLLAGPHSRLAALHSESAQGKKSHIGTPNLFYAGLLRLDEIEFSITNALRLLESEWSDKGEVVSTWQSQAGTGASAVEAPRGTLLYHLEVSSHQTINNLQILVPTELNILALVEITRSVISACLELGWTLDQTMERAQMAIRCFDPCVSCATHTDIRFRG